MKYKQFTVFTETEKLDEIAMELEALGITGLEINDPRDADLFKEGGETSYEWNFVSPEVYKKLEECARITFYVEENKNIPDEAADFLKKSNMKVALVNDEDWLHVWEQYYMPTKLGEKTVVKPVWRDYEPKSGELLINIDPGLAFGTGSSPTTYLAVRLMEKYLKEGCEALDVGCGTGILSILAADLGAKHTTGVDLDPEAVASSKRNVELNNCRDKVDIFKGDLLKGLNIKADLIVANLTAELLIMLCDAIRDHCSKDAIFIASGIIDFKEEVISSVIKSAGFEIIEIMHDDCWVAMAARLL